MARPALEVTYKDAAGRVANELLYRDREPTLEIGEAGRPWSFDGDGALFRLLSEANRIRLAYLFDPLLAVHTSLVEPLPLFDAEPSSFRKLGIGGTSPQFIYADNSAGLTSREPCLRLQFLDVARR